MEIVNVQGVTQLVVKKEDAQCFDVRFPSVETTATLLHVISIKSW